MPLNAKLQKPLPKPSLGNKFAAAQGSSILCQLSHQNDHRMAGWYDFNRSDTAGFPLQSHILKQLRSWGKSDTRAHTLFTLNSHHFCSTWTLLHLHLTRCCFSSVKDRVWHMQRACWNTRHIPINTALLLYCTSSFCCQVKELILPMTVPVFGKYNWNYSLEVLNKHWYDISRLFFPALQLWLLRQQP